MQRNTNTRTHSRSSPCFMQYLRLCDIKLTSYVSVIREVVLLLLHESHYNFSCQRGLTCCFKFRKIPKSLWQSVEEAVLMFNKVSEDTACKWAWKKPWLQIQKKIWLINSYINMTQQLLLLQDSSFPTKAGVSNCVPEGPQCYRVAALKHTESLWKGLEQWARKYRHTDLNKLMLSENKIINYDKLQSFCIVNCV